MAVMETAKTIRYHALDALRGGLMILGIVLHAAMFYLAAPPPGLVAISDVVRTPVADILFHTIHAFRMPAFFVMAGFFAALLLAKGGSLAFIKNRSARILAPFALAVVMLLPSTLLMSSNISLYIRFGVVGWVPDLSLLDQLARELYAAGLPMDKIPLMHLWFLYYLMLYSGLYAIAAAIYQRVQPRAESGASFRHPWLALAAVWLATAVTMWAFPSGQILDIRMGFVQVDASAFVHYGLFFATGIWLHRHRDHALAWIARHTRKWIVAAIVVWPAALVAAHFDMGQPTGSYWHPLAVVGQATLTVMLVLACIGGALSTLDRPTPWVTYVSHCAYWVYLIHLPLCVAVAWALLYVDVPAVVKLGVIIIVVTIASFASYHYLVQGSWVGRLLNGRRLADPWPWRRPT
jgi:glucans biosynthesis protein C